MSSVPEPHIRLATRSPGRGEVSSLMAAAMVALAAPGRFATRHGPAGQRPRGQPDQHVPAPGASRARAGRPAEAQQQLAVLGHLRQAGRVLQLAGQPLEAGRVAARGVDAERLGCLRVDPLDQPYRVHDLREELAAGQRPGPRHGKAEQQERGHDGAQVQQPGPVAAVVGDQRVGPARHLAHRPGVRQPVAHLPGHHGPQSGQEQELHGHGRRRHLRARRGPGPAGRRPARAPARAPVSGQRG